MIIRFLPSRLLCSARLFQVLPLLIALLLALALFGVSRAASSGETDTKPGASNQLFLPLVTAQGAGSPAPTPPPTPSPASPFATMLDQARQRCAEIAVNQACLGNGSAAGFQQTGDRLTLTDGMSMTVRSTSPAVADWTVVVMRIQAAGHEAISQTVVISSVIDLVAVGSVDLKALHLITSTTIVSNMPGVHFENQAVAQGSERAPSGLIVINGADESLLTLAVNGAVMTLGSTAFVEAAAGREMAVKMREGSALVQVADVASAVVAGSEVKVALNTQGTANGAPSEAQTTDDDLIVPLTPDPQKTHNRLATKLFNSLFQCSAGNNPGRVYAAFYYIRQLRTPAMRAVGGEQTVQRHAAMVKDCARFEVIFDSTIIGNNAISWLDQVHSDGTFIQFDVDGNLVARAFSPLQHLQVEMSMPVCALQSIASPNGTFAVEKASLRLYYNTMKVKMETFPYMTREQVPTGHFICPSGTTLTIPIEWNNLFSLLHPELWLPQPIYRLQEEHWKYTGRQIFAEAIFAERSAPFVGGVINSNSYFILRHAPILQ